MMKLCYSIVLTLILVACGKSGNTEEKRPPEELKSNNVLISGIDESYLIAMNGRLMISPKITRENQQTESDLEFEWIIDEKPVSKSKNLNITLPTTLSSGEKRGRYNVHSVKFNKNFSKEFKITVTNPFGYGYYFISVDHAGNSLLSHINIENNSEIVFHTSVVGDIPIGNFVHSLCSYAIYDKIIGQVVHRIFITSQGGTAPHIITENLSLNPLEVISLNHNGISFSPKKHVLGYNYEKVSHFISDNAHLTYENSVLVSKNLTHRFSSIIPGNNDRYLYAYDSSMEAFYRIDTENNHTTIELSGSRSIGEVIGHRVVASYENGVIKEQIMVLTVRKNTVSFYRIMDQQIILEHSFDLPSVASCSTLINETTWMIGAGSAIYRYDETTKRSTSFLTLDRNLGDIERVESVDRGQKLVIATYGEGETLVRGSIVIAEQDKIVKTYPNVFYRCMGIVGCDIKNW